MARHACGGWHDADASDHEQDGITAFAVHPKAVLEATGVGTRVVIGDKRL